MYNHKLVYSTAGCLVLWGPDHDVSVGSMLTRTDLNAPETVRLMV